MVASDLSDEEVSPKKSTAAASGKAVKGNPLVTLAEAATSSGGRLGSRTRSSTVSEQPTQRGKVDGKVAAAR